MARLAAENAALKQLQSAAAVLHSTDIGKNSAAKKMVTCGQEETAKGENNAKGSKSKGSKGAGGGPKGRGRDKNGKK